MVKFLVLETTLLMVSSTAMVAVPADASKLTGIETVMAVALLPALGVSGVVVPFSVKLTDAPVVGKAVPTIIRETAVDWPEVAEVGEMLVITGGARILKLSVFETTLLTVSVTATVAVA